MVDSNTGKRMLAYVQEVGKIEKIDGADNIEKAHVLGWTLIVKKDEFKEGDKCVFFEIDSKVPSNNPTFDFLAKKGYKVKTYKLNKFSVVSQGLILPLATLNIRKDIEINTDLTDILHVTYVESEDNDRKNPARVKKPKNKFVKFLMRYSLFRRLFSKQKFGDFPKSYIRVTDEERVQNMIEILKDKEPFIVTEKVDGMSGTFLLVKKMFSYEFYVCSRNYRQLDKTDNDYWDIAIKYNIEKQLKLYLKEHKKLKWVCIQGEIYGEGIQKNRLKIEGRKLAVFNFIDSNNGKHNSIEAKKILESFEQPMEWVPIVNEKYVLPDTIDEIVAYSNGKSIITPTVLREGIVLRNYDANISFKTVSPEYLIEHNI